MTAENNYDCLICVNYHSQHVNFQFNCFTQLIASVNGLVVNKNDLFFIIKSEILGLQNNMGSRDTDYALWPVQTHNCLWNYVSDRHLVGLLERSLQNIYLVNVIYVTLLSLCTKCRPPLMWQTTGNYKLTWFTV